MAKQLIRYEFDGGDSIFVETDVDDAEPGYERAGIGDIVAKAPEKLRDAFAPVAKTAEIIFEQLKTMHHLPKELSLELAVKFSVRGDVIIAGGEAEANCKLSLKWDDLLPTKKVRECNVDKPHPNVQLFPSTQSERLS